MDGERTIGERRHVGIAGSDVRPRHDVPPEVVDAGGPFATGAAARQADLASNSP